MSLSPNQDRIEVAGTQTVGAVLATAASYTPPAAARINVRALVKALDAGSETSASWELRAAVRVSSGVTVLIGSVLQLVAQFDAGAATWLATLAVSGGVVNVNVTGQVLKTINWDCVLLIDEDF